MERAWRKCRALYCCFPPAKQVHKAAKRLTKLVFNYHPSLLFIPRKMDEGTLMTSEAQNSHDIVWLLGYITRTWGGEWEYWRRLNAAWNTWTAEAPCSAGGKVTPSNCSQKREKETAIRWLRSLSCLSTKTLSVVWLPADHKANFSGTHTNQNGHIDFVAVSDLVQF